MINIVKEQRDIETNELQGYVVNGTIYVPIDPNNTHYQEIQEWIKDGNKPEPAFTEDERLEYFKNKKISELKQIRTNKVSSIVITLSSGEQLNGDEVAQTRINRAITGLPDDTTTIDWIDANNNLVQLTKPKLLEALKLSGQEQTNIWIIYNTIREQINNADLETLQNSEIDWDNKTLKAKDDTDSTV